MQFCKWKGLNLRQLWKHRAYVAWEIQQCKQVRLTGVQFFQIQALQQNCWPDIAFVVSAQGVIIRCHICIDGGTSIYWISLTPFLDVLTAIEIAVEEEQR